MRLAALLIVLGLASTAVAKEKRKKKRPKSHPTVITVVSPTAISIREAKAEKTIAIAPSTEIYVRDQKTDVAALQPGMAVNITLAMDGQKASRISATDPPPVRETTERKPKLKKRR